MLIVSKCLGKSIRMKKVNQDDNIVSWTGPSCGLWVIPLEVNSWADPENSVRGGGGPDNIFFSHQQISQRAVRTSLKGGPYNHF